MGSTLATERRVIVLVGAVQFVNVLDFMMVMPLGPDFAKALDIPLSALGLIGGSYTAAAACAGLAGSFFLDRFDRRSALAVAMLGLVIGTAMGGFATGLPSLMAARMVAGLFGGPATSLSLSIVADVIPPARRGRAFGAVMGATSLAQILGVPTGLWFAEKGGWRAPFLAVAAMGLVLAGGAVFLLPSLRGHLAHRSNARPLAMLHGLLKKPVVLLSYSMTAVVMGAGFLVLPNLSAYIQQNLHYPREHLSRLYFIGGSFNFATMRAAGWAVDRFGSTTVGTLAVAAVSFISYGFLIRVFPIPVMAIFIPFMVSLTLRNVAYNTLASRVPSPEERARFLSIQSAVQHAASSAGAFASSRLLKESADHQLVGIGRVAEISIALSLALPLLFAAVERRVRRSEAANAASQP